MGGGLVEVLDKWAVEILVVLSFTLQVFLLVCGGIRRRGVSVVPRVLLWLSYQLADATALYTLGHLSMSRRPEDQLLLVAFWAPFLLVHLGGQDTITAYAFEDNRLWLRHLQTLVVQVAGAAYVLYKYIPGSDAPVMAASLLMFVVGALKYGERIWALKCASIDSIWSSLKAGDRQRQPQELVVDEEAGRRRRRLDAEEEEEVLMGAHYLLHVCKGLFVGLRRGESEDVKHALQSFRGSHGKLMVTELSLMYDIMYTKAAVIHTWYGCCIRATSLLATATAFLLFFQFSTNKRHGRYQASDIAVTYVLLVGALLLETASSLWAAASTWTLEFLRAKNWRRLRDAVQCLRRLARAPSYRKWSGSVGQYNLFLTCAREGREERRLAKLVGLLGLEAWWNQVHRAASATISDSTMELVLGEIYQMGDIQMLQGGFFSFSRDMIRQRRGYRLDEAAGFNVEDFDLEGSILNWHVATEICLLEDYLKIKEEEKDKCEPLVSAIRLLSNYMMFLLLVRPYMLPGTVLYSRYVQTFDYLRDLMRQPVAAGATAEDRVKSVLRDECSKLFKAPFDYSGPRPPPYLNGVGLAMLLLSTENRDAGEMLQGLFRVWVEMLCFVGDNCNRESHARELCSGGELVTIVWLMRGHTKLCSKAPVMAAASRPVQAEEDEPSWLALAERAWALREPVKTPGYSLEQEETEEEEEEEEEEEDEEEE